jgi:flagellar basal-body rod modification protein FlgD
MTMNILAAQNQASTNGQARTQLSDNFDTFLKLLTAQLANQDPMDPMDSNKFTEQLVAYSQVEQQIRTNEQLDSLISQTRASVGASAVTYLGKRALIDSDRATVTDSGAQWSYAFNQPAERARLVVRDSAGREVFSTSGNTGAGEKSFTWDGIDSSGRRVAPGVYRLSIQAVDANGNPTPARISTEETVLGVGFNNSGVTLRTASGEQNFTAIRSIRD